MVAIEFYFLFLGIDLEFEPGALHMPGKFSTTDLQFSPCKFLQTSCGAHLSSLLVYPGEKLLATGSGHLSLDHIFAGTWHCYHPPFFMSVLLWGPHSIRFLTRISLY